MTKFSETNFRLLRVSKTRAVQLMLLLSKQDVEWFTDMTFQQVLTMLQPLIQARVEYHVQGVPFKQLQPQRSARTGSAMVARAVAAAKATAGRSPSTLSGTGAATPTPSSSSSSAAASGSGAAASPSGAAVNEGDNDAWDGLEDLGMVLGGEEGDTENMNTARRRRRGGAATKAEMPTPRFRVRFGFREHMASERGAMSVLVKKKNLEFKVKSEQSDEIGLSMQGRTQEVDGVRILQEEEDEDALARQLLQQMPVGGDDKAGDNGDDDEEMHQRKKRAGSLSEMGKSGGEYKPTLEITYQPLRMFPMTLYIVIRTEPELPRAESPLLDDDDLLPAGVF
ncbi:hypothetical protein BGZ73_003090 [Actinomortierella ambigua]|nr:hypothetical protein BGZ73_003090 [Actinomortierella ambigua]